MKLLNLSLCLALALTGSLAPAPVAAESSFEVGASFANGDLRSFYLGVGNYYGYEPAYVERLHVHYHLPYDDIPVVLYYADLLDLDPLVVLRLRLRGWAWMDIGWHYHLSPVVFYYPVQYHHYRHRWHPIHYYYDHPRERWHKLRLSDREVVELVNLRYVSEHYAYAPERVLEQRRLGRPYRDIGRSARHERGEGQGRFEPRAVRQASALPTGEGRTRSRHERRVDPAPERDAMTTRDERRETGAAHEQPQERRWSTAAPERRREQERRDHEPRDHELARPREIREERHGAGSRPELARATEPLRQRESLRERESRRERASFDREPQREARPERRARDVEPRAERRERQLERVDRRDSAHQRGHREREPH